MQSISRRLPSPAMLVAVLALVVALSGTAVAASTLVNGDSLIKKGSLSGNRLRSHTLTGKQIKLSKLGTVPQASFAANAGHATSATNATKAASATNATHATSADSATLAQTLPALVWHPLTLINGWVDYNGSSDARTPAYAVDAQGIVHFRGAIHNPSTSANGQFATLPASVLPSQDVWLATDMFDAAPGRIDVFTDGSVYAEWSTLGNETESSATDFTDLDGVSYPLG